MAVLDATRARPAPFIGIWGRVPSTNEVAKAIALDAGAVRLAGSVLIAETQTEGKGRFGRTWVSPPGGLYLSVLVEPPAGPGEPAADPLTLLPLAAGVAVAQAVRRAAGIPAELRWPNDLDWKGRKVAGVLAEVGFRRESPRLAVVGFGVNLTPVSLPAAACGGHLGVAARAHSAAAGLAPGRRGPGRTCPGPGDVPGRGPRSAPEGPGVAAGPLGSDQPHRTRLPRRGAAARLRAGARDDRRTRRRRRPAGPGRRRRDAGGDRE